MLNSFIRTSGAANIRFTELRQTPQHRIVLFPIVVSYYKSELASQQPCGEKGAFRNYRRAYNARIPSSTDGGDSWQVQPNVGHS